MQNAGKVDVNRMPSLTIKKFPDQLLLRLKEKALGSRRSLTQEVLSRLEDSLEARGLSATTERPKLEAERQVAAWKVLSGKWNSGLTVAEEIDSLYKARSRGRKVDL